MSQNKKLIAEIERTLKKISEGIELFDNIWDKLHNTSSSSLKDRFQSELKTEIKKLQRMRDQIKTWQGMSDVRDKRGIEEARKHIETKMEQFKACEREAKIKTFSKIGLSLPSKEDPEEVAKESMRSWLNSSIDTLKLSIDSVEADIETAMARNQKRKRAAKLASADTEVQRERIANYKFHIGKLEAVMRMLDNGKVTVDEIEPIQDIVNQFIEHNADKDYDPSEVEGVYDCLLPDDMEAFPDTPTQPVVEPKHKPADEPVVLSKREERKRKKREASEADSKASTPTTPSIATPPSQSLAQGAAAASSTATAAAPAATAATPTATSSASSSAGPSKAAASGAAPPASSASSAGSTPTTAASSSAVQSPATPATAVQPKASPPTAAGNYAQAAKQKAQQPVQKKGPSAATTPTATPPQPVLDSRAGGGRQSTAAQGNTRKGARDSSPSTPTTPAKVSVRQQQQQQQPQQQPQQTTPGAPPPLTSRPMTAVSQRISGEKKANIERMLQQSHNNLLTPDDTRKRHTYVPSNPMQTASYYPQEPHPVLEHPDTIANFDPDTLFFIFYYQQNTYQQYLAAKELKKKSWRFHKRYQTWFQRADPPIYVNEEYEQGNYVYFDYEDGWSTRLKSNFTFKYSYLEDELQT